MSCDQLDGKELLKSHFFNFHTKMFVLLCFTQKQNHSTSSFFVKTFFFLLLCKCSFKFGYFLRNKKIIGSGNFFFDYSSTSVKDSLNIKERGLICFPIVHQVLLELNSSIFVHKIIQIKISLSEMNSVLLFLLMKQIKKSLFYMIGFISGVVILW